MNFLLIIGIYVENNLTVRGLIKAGEGLNLINYDLRQNVRTAESQHYKLHTLSVSNPLPSQSIIQ